MDTIRATPELLRIRDLPRRAPSSIDLAKELTAVLRTEHGRMTLRPLQALALHDIAIHRGAFLAIEVGGGKTLISLLAPYVLDAKRPLLLLPANLVEKTVRDCGEYARDWVVTEGMNIQSYEMISRVEQEHWLDLYRPDLIIADECHKLKNRRAAVTRRVTRYMKTHPETLFVGMTGTIMRKSLRDFAHVLQWALKNRAPVPRTEWELDEWCRALDEHIGGWQGDELGRLDPGALLSLCVPDDLKAANGNVITAARLGFQRRLHETPGVIATTEALPVDAALKIRALPYRATLAMEDSFRHLRKTWSSPVDQWPLTSGAEVWADAKELALGVSYTWSPRPPADWIEARKAWGSFVRETISRSKHLDSERHVADAVRAGALKDGGCLERWREIRDTFIPNSVPVWIDDSVLHLCAQWAAESPGIVWTEHHWFAERLSRETGLPYYGPRGRTVDGAFINDAPAGRSIIASADANREGRNLQAKWSRNLITSPAEGSDYWTQLIGRTHRPGQTAAAVTVDVLLGCSEHDRAMRKALSSAQAVFETTGAEGKLLLADIDWPSIDEVSRYMCPSWGVVEEKAQAAR